MSRYEAGVAAPAPSGARPAAVGAGSDERTSSDVVRRSACAIDRRLRFSAASSSSAFRPRLLRTAFRPAWDEAEVFRGCGFEELRRGSVIGPLSQIGWGALRDVDGRSSMYIEGRHRRRSVPVTITQIDLDDDELDQAMRFLGTATETDTVNAALREVNARRRRLAALKRLAERYERGGSAAAEAAWERRKACA